MYSFVLSDVLDRFRAFRKDEDGGVTADWVVLVSGLVLFGLAHVKDVADGSLIIAEDISSCLSTDIANAVRNSDPGNFEANMQAAATACSS